MKKNDPIENKQTNKEYTEHIKKCIMEDDIFEEFNEDSKNIKLLLRISFE